MVSAPASHPPLEARSGPSRHGTLVGEERRAWKAPGYRIPDGPIACCPWDVRGAWKRAAAGPGAPWGRWRTTCAATWPPAGMQHGQPGAVLSRGPAERTTSQAVPGAPIPHALRRSPCRPSPPALSAGRDPAPAWQRPQQGRMGAWRGGRRRPACSGTRPHRHVGPEPPKGAAPRAPPGARWAVGWESWAGGPVVLSRAWPATRPGQWMDAVAFQQASPGARRRARKPTQRQGLAERKAEGTVWPEVHPGPPPGGREGAPVVPGRVENRATTVLKAPKAFGPGHRVAGRPLGRRSPAVPCAGSQGLSGRWGDAGRRFCWAGGLS